MVLSRKYVAIALAFALGIVAAIGISVHAQTAVATTSATPGQSAAMTGTTQISDGDGETADDAATGGTDANEAEGASDAGEIEDGN